MAYGINPTLAGPRNTPYNPSNANYGARGGVNVMGASKANAAQTAPQTTSTGGVNVMGATYNTGGIPPATMSPPAPPTTTPGNTQPGATYNTGGIPPATTPGNTQPPSPMTTTPGNTQPPSPMTTTPGNTQPGATYNTGGIPLEQRRAAYARYLRSNRGY